jgi:hypothetical protein
MRLVRQGGSSNPKGGASRKTIEGTGKASGRRGLERPPIEEIRFMVYPDGMLRISILSERSGVRASELLLVE